MIDLIQVEWLRASHWVTPLRSKYLHFAEVATHSFATPSSRSRQALAGILLLRSSVSLSFPFLQTPCRDIMRKERAAPCPRLVGLSVGIL